MKEKVTKQELAEKIKAADNILIATTGAPRIDHLSACVGLFEVLRDSDKNPAFVYSKDIPGAIGFLEPEKVVQQDAESLRDFIISFDRAKVDKFRYNQEGDQYNILLTPARLQVINEADMKYRKGDFNIDLVLTLGVDGKVNIDPAISEHGQLTSEIPLVNVVAGRKGSNWEVACWQEDAVPALAEMIFELSQALGVSALSKRAANALLTGIVDQTERYKDRQTKSRTMHVSAELLELGADLQLINENLAQTRDMPVEIPEAEAEEAAVEEKVGEASEHDTQRIKGKKKQAAGQSGRLYMRQGDLEGSGLSYGEKAAQKGEQEEYQLDQLNIDDEGNLRIISEEEAEGAATAPASQPAAEAPAPAAAADQGAQQMPAGRGQSSPLISRNVTTPPATGSPAAAVPPPIAGQTPSISEIVDRTAGEAAQPAASPAPAVPGLSEKVDALSPVNAGKSDTSNYIDSLMGPPGGVQPEAQSQTAPAAPADPSQAMTVDNYLAQQPAPAEPPADGQSQAPPAAGDGQSGPYAPPAAPPLASMT